jgi:hypothetical protein
MVLDALRNRLRQLDHVADSSFESALVKLSANALVALIEHYIPSEERPVVEAILRKAGIQRSDLHSLLAAILQVAGKKLLASWVTKSFKILVIKQRTSSVMFLTNRQLRLATALNPA